MKHRTKPCRGPRAALDHARQGHLRAIHAAIAGGTPAGELLCDLWAFFRAAVQLLCIVPRLGAGAQAGWWGGR